MTIETTKTAIAAAAQIGAESTRDDLIGWLSANDSNGVYSDAACKAEGCPSLTLSGAWQMVAIAALDLDDGATVIAVW